MNGLLICLYYFISFPKWLASLLLADLLSLFQLFFLKKLVLSMNQIIWITVIENNDVGAGKYALLMLWVQN